MNNRLSLLALTGLSAVALLTAPVNAQQRYRRAEPVSAVDPNQGRCTVSVLVDRSADVEIREDSATLRNSYGRPARWQRFECTGPLPYSPAGMQIRAIEGNGRVTLTHDSANGGVAIVQVRNPDYQDQIYTFDVFWDNSRPAASGFAERSADDESVEACRNAVSNRMRDDGYGAVHFGSINVNGRGATNWVTGSASANRSNGADGFNFSCRVTRDGDVSRLDVTRR